jgi:hypothetical protein
MNKIAKRLVAAASAVAVAGGLVVASALPASANLTVWDRTGFTGTKLADTGTASSVVDVADDRTRSTRNTLSFGYSARNNTALGFSVEVTYFPSGYQLSSYGSSNDTVDHFDRVG